MYDYQIAYRPGAVEMSRANVRAWRVEGWNRDYAFFGDGDDLSMPTEIIPREIVMAVTRSKVPVSIRVSKEGEFVKGDKDNYHNEMGKQANAFQAAVRAWGYATARDLRSVVGTEKVYIEEQRPDGLWQSVYFDRSCFTTDETAYLVNSLMNGDWAKA